MLVSDAQRTPLADLPLDLQASLFGIRILHVPIHRAEVDEHAGRQARAGQDAGKCRCADLRGGEAHADLAEVGGFYVLSADRRAFASARNGTRS